MNTKIVRRKLFIFFAGSTLGFMIVTTFPFFLLYRFLVASCAKLLRGDLQSMISGIDALLALDINHWDTKPENSIAATLTLNSRLSEEKVFTFFEELIAQKKYKRLTQTIVPWMGFVFWKTENSFLLQNHIFVVDKEDDQVQDGKWLNKFTKKLLTHPFGRMQSPWSVHIILNYQPTSESREMSAVLFRFHHSLADGHSCLKMFSRAFDNYTPIKYENTKKVISNSQLISSATRLFSPYLLMKHYLESTDWNNKICANYSGQMSIGHVKEPVEKLLLVRQKYKVGINAIIFSGITTALRNILLCKNSNIPHKLHIGIPTPKENHPEYLCNHCKGTTLSLPVGIGDPVCRLVSINSSLEKLGSSEMEELVDFYSKLLGYLPYSVPDKIRFQLSGVVSVLPLGALNKIFECPIEEYRVSYAVPERHIDAGIVIFGAINHGYLQLTGNFDKFILASDELATEIMTDIGGHFDLLLRL